MAKKATRKPAKPFVPQAIATTSIEQFTIGGNLDVSDVLSVVTSKAEDRYSQELQRCRTEVKELESANNKLRKTINDQIVKDIDDSSKDDVKSLRTAMKKFQGSVSVHVTHAFNNNLHTNDEGCLEGQVTVKCGNGFNSVLQFRVNAKPSKELLALVKEFDDNVNAIRTLNEEAFSWRRKLNNIPMLERRYRARIASTKLASNKDGQQLLDLLTSDLEESILNLPSM